MIIAISGAGGLIGKKLTAYFESKGHEVRRIPRIVTGTEPTKVAVSVAGAHVIINLAGAPIIGRWTVSYKKELLESRVVTTRKIVEAIGLNSEKPGLLISASAIGIYAPEKEQTEDNFSISDDYLGEICQAWENEARKAIPLTRVVIARFGVVLDSNGGALAKMLPVFRFGLGGKIASGRQGFSWIHISDLAEAMNFLIENKNLSGDFSFTAPGVTNNKGFTKTLAKVLKRPAFFTVPAFILKIVFGEGAIALTGGQFAPPKHLLDAGYRFSFPDLESALKDLIYRK